MLACGSNALQPTGTHILPDERLEQVSDADAVQRQLAAYIESVTALCRSRKPRRCVRDPGDPKRRRRPRK